MKTKIAFISIMIMVLLVGCASKNENSAANNDVTQNEIRLNEGELLPLGSVVLLKGGSKTIMICGRAQQKDNTVYDYVAVYYPEGFIDSNKLFLFNHEKIDKVLYVGFEDDEELNFRKNLTEKLEELRDN